MVNNDYYRNPWKPQMLAGVKPSCETCRYFRRIDAGASDSHLTAVASADRPDDIVEPEALQEFGRCIRNPPQFFYETLNGEWPIVHETRVCGEYRVTDSNPYCN